MRKNLASRGFGLLPLLLVLGPSCSLVYDLSPDQCGSDTDCDHFGANLSCRNGICVCLAGNACSSVASGGKGGTGGTSGGAGGSTGGTVTTGGTAGDAGMMETGGTAAIGGTGGTNGGTSGSNGGGKGGTTGGKGGAGGTTGGTSGDAGMGGAPPPPECSTTADCYELHKTEFKTNPYACVGDQCVPLITDECPIVLPISEVGTWQSLLSKDPIMLGGFGYINRPGLYSTATRNYDLALDEMNTTTNGVWAGSGTRHKMVMVVCDSHVPAPKTVDIPAQHLINDLKIKGIVSELDAGDQLTVFETYGQDNDVFFVMPPYPDHRLLELADDGLVWNMLSGGDELSVTFQPLIEMTEAHLRTLGSIPTGTNNMKVALIVGQDQVFLQDMANYITDNVTFNGAKAGENGMATFQTFGITSYYTDSMADYSTTVQDLVAFAPQVIIGATTDEAVRSIIPLIESDWDTATSGLDRPFYILSPLDYNINGMSTLISTSDTKTNNTGVPLFQRVIGINWPAAVDQTIYNAYQDRFVTKYHYAAPFYDNYYDAAWFLLYGVAGSAQPVGGIAIRDGLIRATRGTTQYPVGPDDALDAVNTLKNGGAKIQVVGAGGPPNWDTQGTRDDPGTVWCVNQVGTYFPDQYRYNTSTKELDGTTWFTTCNFHFPAP